MKLPVNLVKKCCDFTTDVKIGEGAQRFWFTTVKHKFNPGELCVSTEPTNNAVCIYGGKQHNPGLDTQDIPTAFPKCCLGVLLHMAALSTLQVGISSQ